MDKELIDQLIAHDTFERMYVPGEYQKQCKVGVKELVVSPDAVRKIAQRVVEQLLARRDTIVKLQQEIAVLKEVLDIKETNRD